MKHFSRILLLTDLVKLNLGRFKFGQNRQMVGDHCTPDVLFKPFPLAPGASGQSKGPLQSGNVRLYPCSKIFKHLVDPEALNHLQNRKPSFLGERNTFNSHELGVSGSKLIKISGSNKKAVCSDTAFLSLYFYNLTQNGFYRLFTEPSLLIRH